MQRPAPELPKYKVRKIYGFAHVALINDWEKIFGEQMEKCVRSGLYEKSEKIFVSLLGPECERVKFPLEKIEIFHRSANLREYEFPALRKIHEICQNENCFLWYIHTKGVSVTDYRKKFVEDWRKLLDYFIIERSTDCLMWLEKNYDVCGINWKKEPWGHFYGNFWWARSEYIRKLPSIDEKFSKLRHNAERWIGMGNKVRVKNIFNSTFRTKIFFRKGVNHYEQPYPEEKYRK